jgi:hypothetical protein
MTLGSSPGFVDIPDATVGTSGMATIAVNAGGTSYQVGDILTVLAGGASGGTLLVTTVSSGAVTGATIVAPGQGYTVTNGLATTGGHGSGCTINITALQNAVVTDDVAVKILQNAKFGCVRFETIFMGYFKHGDTVPQPVSPVDQYTYARNEVVYDFALYSTRQPAQGFVSGQATAPAISSVSTPNLYWTRAGINDATGIVSIDVSYYQPKGTETITHDGIVKVVALCQRASINTQS